MAKYIMVQGTMSNAGKSFLAAGLCRIFHQDGYRTAPFKSQNMALNSFVTEEGLEMGRAQVVQAEAASVRPVVEMNPILLKPTGHMESQVIVRGEILGNYSAADYYKLKKELVPVIRQSLEKLSEAYDIIVIEGAGSPAEINLKEFDIVNMGMAKMAGAPVILVGDIDRGGVFASLYGTIKLLDRKEQEMIKGIVINKFRGDIKLLEPGLKMIEDLTGIPVLGVIPMEEIDIEEEDSLAERLRRRERSRGLDVGIIRLPHISNFTDFTVLERMKGLSVRYVEKAEEFGNPDAVILPGTKNTIGDLRWLKNSGLGEWILGAARTGIPIIGICGGFQMLGKRIIDPYGVEEQGMEEGLGLLDAETIFSQKKVRMQVKGVIKNEIPGWPELTGRMVEGYEIHMGLTRNLGDCKEFLTTDKGEKTASKAVSGLCSSDGKVWGTYLHGFFDAPGIAEAWTVGIEKRAAEKGKNGISEKKERESFGETKKEKTDKSWREYKEEQYNKLADLVRRFLDMKAVYQILEDGE